MNIIHKSKKYGEIEFLIDDEDYELIKNKKLTTNMHGYIYVVIEWNKVVSLHRLILGIKKGNRDHVDHINRNKLDNRKENLRLCTPAENMRNKPGENGFKGVSFDHRINKWRARIVLAKKEYWIGYFATEIEAAKAYDQAARYFHLDFAYLNFPDINEEIVDIEKILNHKKFQKSNYNGVTLNGNRWRTRVRVNNKLIHIGYFSTELEAAVAYDKYLEDHSLGLPFFKKNF